MGVGHGCSGAVVSWFCFSTLLKPLVSSGSRIPWAADVGKYTPYPPRTTDLSPKRRANPTRGATLFLSPFTRPRPMPSPDWLAVTTGTKLVKRASKNGIVFSDGTTIRPLRPVVESTNVGSKFIRRSFLSTNGDRYS